MPHDLVLRQATVISGDGSPRFEADIAVTGDRITAIGRLDGVKGAREIDAKAKIVAPGFIDVHTHDDGALLAPQGMDAKISQGVTTVIAGNCGVSLAPLLLDKTRRPLSPWSAVRRVSASTASPIMWPSSKAAASPPTPLCSSATRPCASA